MNTPLSAFVIRASLLLFCTVSPAAFADGMPFKEKAPEPILTPLDKALSDIETNKESAPETQPAATAVTPPETAAPVPESRVVEVQPDTSFFGLSVGMYDPFTHNEKAASFNVEWQPGVKIAGFLQPLFGAMVTTNGAMLGYGGLGVPFNISDHVMLMPSVAIGGYKKGGGFDLHQVLAYRIGTELAYQFDDKSRIGLNMHVLTNGQSAGREDRTEVFGITYTTPLDMTPAPVKPAGEAPAEQLAPPPLPPAHETH